MRIAILGAGAWGTALAVSLAARHQIVLYARSAELAGEIASHGENRRYLPGIGLPAAIRCSAELSHAVRDADLIVVATPVAGLRPTCSALHAHEVTRLVWLCKGFEEHTGLLPHQIVAEVLPQVRGAVLSGPSFALEVARGQPTALTAASADGPLLSQCVDAFHGNLLRVYRSDDLVGVEVGGAVKNVLALATGICDGLELGLNARAALMTRGLSEMMRLGIALGARSETLMGLSGVGDLVLTCTGALSRNRAVGLALGSGEALPAILARLGHVAEGVLCARAVLDLARRHGVEMPITAVVCSVLFEGLPASEGVAALFARAPRSEN